MQKNIFILIVFLIINACNSGDNTDNKRKALESYKTQQAELEEKIRVIEEDLRNAGVSPVSDRRVRPVKTRILEKGAFSHYIHVQGDAYTDQNVLLNPEVSGIVQQVFFEEGDFAEKGQTILKLDDELIRRNIEEVNTALDLARSIYQRQKNLWNREIGSEIEYLRAENEVKRLEKNLETLNTQLRQTRIKAPFSGYVDELNIKEGEYASPSNPVVRMINLDKMKIRTRISEAYRKNIEGLDSAMVYFPSIEKAQTYPVKHISHMIDPGDRTFRVSILADNTDHRIKPNMPATVRIRDYHQDAVLKVPVNIVYREQESSYVYVVVNRNDNRIVEKRMIKTGLTYEGETEVHSGLQSGDEVIIQGYNNVSAGDLVQVVE